MSPNGHASSMLMQTGTECRRRLQAVQAILAVHSCALPLGGRVAKLEGLVRGARRARESQPQRQVVLQTRIAQGHEGALTRLQVSATVEGLVCRG